MPRSRKRCRQCHLTKPYISGNGLCGQCALKNSITNAKMMIQLSQDYSKKVKPL